VRELEGRRAQLWSEISSRVSDLLETVSGLTDDDLAMTCEAEGWSVAFVGCHISFGLRRQANWARRALAGSGPTHFDWERTHMLNALLVRSSARLDRPGVIRALTDGAERWSDLLRRATDEDLERPAFRQGEHVRSVGWVAGVVVPRHIDEHARSIRAALDAPSRL
jgi:hypothetical protein